MRWWGPFDPETALRRARIELRRSSSTARSPAGWCSRRRTGGSTATCAFDIALTTSLHGRGYGQEALRVAIRQFIARGHHRFTIDPAADNERAIRTYAALGFKPVGVLRAYERRDGAWHDGLLMDLLAEEFVDG